MMHDHAITLWIAIVFIAISSAPSVIKEKDDSVCYVNVSITRSRQIPLTETYKTVYGWCPVCFEITQTYTRYNTTYEPVWVPKEVCCEGYEYKNGTCEPQCQSNCTNGYCAKPNNCACNYGWVGDSCDEPLSCIVRINLTEKIRVLPLGDVQNVNESRQIERMRPECHSECQEQLNTTGVNIVRFGDQDYYFVPIDSPCNAPAVCLKEYSSLIGGVMGSLLFAVIILGLYVYLVRKKRKTRNKMTDQPTKFVVSECMVENEIYS